MPTFAEVGRHLLREHSEREPVRGDVARILEVDRRVRDARRGNLGLGLGDVLLDRRDVGSEPRNIDGIMPAAWIAPAPASDDVARIVERVADRRLDVRVRRDRRDLRVLVREQEEDVRGRRLLEVHVLQPVRLGRRQVECDLVRAALHVEQLGWRGHVAQDHRAEVRLPAPVARVRGHHDLRRDVVALQHVRAAARRGRVRNDSALSLLSAPTDALPP